MTNALQPDVRLQVFNEIAIIHDVSVHGTVTAVNEMFCAVLGRSESELLGAAHSQIFPDSASSLDWIAQHSEYGTSGLRKGTTLVKSQAGDSIWLSTTIAPKTAPDGTVTGFTCVSLDVTEITALREQAKHDSKLAQLGKLTATVAHEIRNPLGAIRTAAFVLEKKLNGEIEGVAPQLVRINNGIRRCDKIITELLDFSRKPSPKTELVPIDSWISDFIDEEGRVLPEGGRINIEPGMPGLTVRMDPDQMRQVLANLINNACDAMSEKVAANKTGEPYKPELKILTRLSGPSAEILVADNGPGMDEKTLKQVREPLFTTKSFGVGLGIPVIEKILMNHGGGLDIETEYGKGTTMIARILVAGQIEQAA